MDVLGVSASFSQPVVPSTYSRESYVLNLQLLFRNDGIS